MRGSSLRNSLIDDEAGKDSLHGYWIDRHEDYSNGERGDKDQDQQIDRFLDISSDIIDECDEQVEEESGQASDHQLP